jgi:hypothetical protein
MTIQQFYQHLNLTHSDNEENNLYLLFFEYRSKHDELLKEVEYYFYSFHSVTLTKSECASLIEILDCSAFAPFLVTEELKKYGQDNVQKVGNDYTKF